MPARPPVPSWRLSVLAAWRRVYPGNIRDIVGPTLVSEGTAETIGLFYVPHHPQIAVASAALAWDELADRGVVPIRVARLPSRLLPRHTIVIAGR